MSNAKPIILRIKYADGYVSSFSRLNFLLLSMLSSFQNGLVDSSRIEYDDRVVFEIEENGST